MHSGGFMKIVLSMFLVLLVSCTTNTTINKPLITDNNIPKVDDKIDLLLSQWEESIRNGDRDLFLTLFNEDSSSMGYVDRSGKRVSLGDMEAVRELRMKFIKDFGPAELYKLPSPQWEGLVDDNVYSSEFYHENLDIDEVFIFRPQDGIWKISHYLLTLAPPGTWVTNEFQVLGDQNKDGFLTDEEPLNLFNQTRNFLQKPHYVDNDIDDFFDRNGDDTVSIDEIKLSIRAIFFDGMKQFQKIRMGWVPEILDHDQSGKVDSTEFEEVYRFMLSNYTDYQTYPANNNFDTVLDRDTDGNISSTEIEYGRDELIELAVVMSFSDTVFLAESRTVSNLLDEYGDSNFNGKISPYENDEIIASFQTDREVVTDMDHIIDKNRNGTIDAHEIMMVLQDSALGRSFTNKKSCPPYQVRTAIDRLIDNNRDGLVDISELNIVASLYAGNQEAVDSISSEMAKEIDINGDRIVNTSEIENSKSRLLFPHPVCSKNSLDSKLDRDIDGIVNFQELGITGGYTDKGEIPTLERRISVIRRRGSITNPTGVMVKKGVSEGTNLAVLGVKANEEIITQGDITGIIMFLENAFVNSNAVNVIDRKNTSLVLDEMNFQLSGLVNEESIVEVGNLTGADLLAVSEITKVEGTFYFNVKILEVRTAEIIRSILSRANSPQDFPDMCESAVNDLF